MAYGEIEGLTEQEKFHEEIKIQSRTKFGSDAKPDLVYALKLKIQEYTKTIEQLQREVVGLQKTKEKYAAKLAELEA